MQDRKASHRCNEMQMCVAGGFRIDASCCGFAEREVSTTGLLWGSATIACGRQAQGITPTILAIIKCTNGHCRGNDKPLRGAEGVRS